MNILKPKERTTLVQLLHAQSQPTSAMKELMALRDLPNRTPAQIVADRVGANSPTITTCKPKAVVNRP